MKQHPFHLARALLHLCLLALVSGAGCSDRPASSGAGEAPVPTRPAGGWEARVREELLAAMRERVTMRERFGDPGVMWLVPQGKPTHDLAALLVDFEK